MSSLVHLTQLLDVLPVESVGTFLAAARESVPMAQLEQVLAPLGSRDPKAVLQLLQADEGLPVRQAVAEHYGAFWAHFVQTHPQRSGLIADLADQKGALSVFEVWGKRNKPMPLMPLPLIQWLESGEIDPRIRDMTLAFPQSSSRRQDFYDHIKPHLRGFYTAMSKAHYDQIYRWFLAGF